MKLLFSWSIRLSNQNQSLAQFRNAHANGNCSAVSPNGPMPSVTTLSVRQKRHTAVARKSAQKAERIRVVICAMCGIAWQLACSLPSQKSYGV